MEFIKKGSVLPIPFNIIPTPALIFDFIQKFFSKKKNNQNNTFMMDKKRAEISKTNGITNAKKSDEMTFKVRIYYFLLFYSWFKFFFPAK
jgi:hypothetical protein